MAVSGVDGSSSEYNGKPGQIQVNNAGQQPVNSVWAEVIDNGNGKVDVEDVKFYNCEANEAIQAFLEKNIGKLWSEVNDSMKKLLDNFNYTMNKKAQFEQARRDIQEKHEQFMSPDNHIDYEQFKKDALAEYNEFKESAMSEYNEFKESAMSEYNEAKDEAIKQHVDFKADAVKGQESFVRESVNEILDTLQQEEYSGHVLLGDKEITYDNGAFLVNGDNEHPVSRDDVNRMIEDAIKNGDAISGVSQKYTIQRG